VWINIHSGEISALEKYLLWRRLSEEIFSQPIRDLRGTYAAEIKT
jgi:hypothetical protein